METINNNNKERNLYEVVNKPKLISDEILKKTEIRSIEKESLDRVFKLLTNLGNKYINLLIFYNFKNKKNLQMMTLTSSNI